jgi:hypothetical protein
VVADCPVALDAGTPNITPVRAATRASARVGDVVMRNPSLSRGREPLTVIVLGVFRRMYTVTASQWLRVATRIIVLARQRLHMAQTT